MCDEFRDLEYDTKKLKEEKCPKCKRDYDGKLIRIYDMLAFKCNYCGKQWTVPLSSFVTNW